MLTKQDYENLRALLSHAPFSGINEAMIGVVLYNKLEILIAQAEAVETDGVGSDSP